MTDFIKRVALIFYIVTLLLFIAGGFTQNQLVQNFSKPLLMPLLMAMVALTISAHRNRLIILLALFCSFAGDTFLLFEYKNEDFFIPGLISFLFTHLLYIIYFFSLKKTKPSLLKTSPFISLFIVSYAVLLLYILFPALGILKIPVIIYTIIIMGMFLTSLHIYNSVKPAAGKLFISGAFLFVLSDSLLAINKFYSTLGNFSFLIILTYCFAQLLIVKGFIHNAQDPSE